ncbi:MAG: peptidase M24 [Epulopiscium sp. Nuni2H_MBin003]|nr:MAG: peptidase M24 [Epulopiscium sp. Nuni2H_MBin003]
MIKQRLEELRLLMQQRGIDVYYIPSADFHNSEEVGEHFRAREYMSGFTGSSGCLIVTATEAVLYTDGRYFIQAEKQLANTEIKLYKMGVPDVPKKYDYVRDVIPEGGKLGFDGRVVDVKAGVKFQQKISTKNATIVYNEDLVGLVWKNRPNIAFSKAFILDEKYTGESLGDKLNRVRDEMTKMNVKVHVINTLDDIAWLYNIRGNDIPHFPVILAYTIVTLDSAVIFVDENKLTDEIKELFVQNKINILPYNDIYEYVKKIAEPVLIDIEKLNYCLYANLNATKIEADNPTMLFKAIKNDTEIENVRNCHIRDGVACTKFMYWLKHNKDITEIDAQKKMTELRREQELYIEDSFTTISAFKENAAIMHYSVTEESNVKLSDAGLYLIDSGGQYFDGTTDITRTIAISEIDSTLKLHYTAVLRGMINLSCAKFLEGVTGRNLDILARGPVWDLDIDYRSGTGHGIGFVLNVHEGPNGIRWRVVPERRDSCILKAGMITTNEPGIYIENSHGIRIENELLIQEHAVNEYGKFLKFETITLAPIDIDAIEPTLMNQKEKDWLNEYHKLVYEKISPYLEEKEKSWLKIYTRDI